MLAPNLPTTREACRARLAEVTGEIATIKAEIAARDMERQKRHRPMDADWYHRAKTALKHRQQEAAALTAHLATLPPERLADIRDRLIEAVRGDYDDAGWQAVIEKAHRLMREDV